MNIILLTQKDMDGSNSLVRLTGRRFRHIRDILHASAGNELRVGLLGGKAGIGTVVRIGDASLEMDVRLDREPPSPLPLTLILALPRPKVLRRVIFSLTVLGVKRIVLINSTRVEKSYWQTPFLGDGAITKQLSLGLEQACDTVLPEVIQRTRFRPFIEDELPSLMAGTDLLLAQPNAGHPFPESLRGPVTLAVGPEGGFVPYEVEKFVSLGFTAVRLGERTLNVETALSALVARLF